MQSNRSRSETRQNMAQFSKSNLLDQLSDIQGGDVGEQGNLSDYERIQELV